MGEQETDLLNDYLAVIRHDAILSADRHAAPRLERPQDLMLALAQVDRGPLENLAPGVVGRREPVRGGVIYGVLGGGVAHGAAPCVAALRRQVARGLHHDDETVLELLIWAKIVKFRKVLCC